MAVASLGDGRGRAAVLCRQVLAVGGGWGRVGVRVRIQVQVVFAGLPATGTVIAVTHVRAARCRWRGHASDDVGPRGNQEKVTGVPGPVYKALELRVLSKLSGGRPAGWHNLQFIFSLSLSASTAKAW